ncbi:MAG: CHAT domain-containing protein [Pirellulaceae bacterium]|nr:CHAT domain-containing protein [Pirellulaceae bacterium]
MRHPTCCCTVVLPVMLFVNLLQPSWTQAQSPQPSSQSESQLDTRRQQLVEASRLNKQVLDSLRRGIVSDETVAVAQLALQIRCELLGENSRNSVTSLNNLGLVHKALGDHSRAEPLLKQTVQLRQELYGESHRLYLESLNNLAELYAAMGNDAQAEKLYQRVVELESSPAKVPSTMIAGGQELVPQRNALVVGLLARCKLNNFDTATDELSQLYDIEVRMYGEIPRGYRDRNSVGIFGFGTDYQIHSVAAEVLDAIDFQVSQLAENGKCSEAIPIASVAKQIHERVLSIEHSDYANSLEQLALLCIASERWEKAEELLLKASSIGDRRVGKAKCEEARQLHNLGVVQDALGKTDAALESYLNAQLVYADAWKTWPVETGFLSRFGNFEKAVARFEYAMGLLGLANHYFASGRLEESAAFYRQAHETEVAKGIRLGEDATIRQLPFFTDIIFGLARYHQTRGESEQALNQYRELLPAVRANLEKSIVASADSLSMDRQESLRYNLDFYLDCCQLDGHSANDAYDELLAWKGTIFEKQRTLRRLADSPDLAPALISLQHAARDLSSHWSMTQQEDSGLFRNLAESQARYDLAIQHLTDVSSDFRTLRDPVHTAAVQACVPENAALIDFVELTEPNRLIAFVVRHSGIVEMVDLGELSQIHELSLQWRNDIEAEKSHPASAGQLHSRLWQPLESHLEGKSLILISTEGNLGQIPFSALPGKTHDSYLIEDYAIAMVPVPRLLPLLVARESVKRLSDGLLAVGGVAYDSVDQDFVAKSTKSKGWRTPTQELRGRPAFTPLPGTAGEVASIAQMFEEIFSPDKDELRTLRDASATEESFRELAPKYFNIHIATHGFFQSSDRLRNNPNSDKPPVRRLKPVTTNVDQDGYPWQQRSNQFSPGLLSGLAFAGANLPATPERDDGILTAEEISSLSLEGVDLVVLSACETGLGKDAGGEGLLGVQRAFQVAGAKATVASLWNVSDSATRRLMEQFYRNYWQRDMSKLDALRAAQLQLLDEPDESRGSIVVNATEPTNQGSRRLPPKYWAAFSLSGDWR